MFVAIEGIEASGKSTLASLLAGRLEADGRDVLLTREPGGTPVGDAVRVIFLDRSIRIEPLAEALLIAAARVQHVSRAIAPALRAGRAVVCDRFVDSTLAYQGYGRGLDLGVLRDLCATATGGVEPDLTLLVDVPVDVSRERRRLRGGPMDRLEGEDDAFYRRVRDGYLQISQSPRHCVLDGTLAPLDVLAQALAVLTEAISSNGAS
jgi:dTMP kinase